MADSHPKNLDPRPKRRRDEDSPYEIYTAGINTAHPRFYLFFKDGGGVKRWIEIDKALFDAFNRPLAKLAQAVKVADASNQRKAKCKTVSAIAVALREDTKSFDKADNVFNKDTIF